jgi:hypothetical protein
MRQLAIAAVVLVTLAGMVGTQEKGLYLPRSPSAGEREAPQAPIGHRRTNANSLPSGLFQQELKGDNEPSIEERELDRRLRICRDCQLYPHCVILQSPQAS